MGRGDGEDKRPAATPKLRGTAVDLNPGTLDGFWGLLAVPRVELTAEGNGSWCPATWCSETYGSGPRFTDSKRSSHLTTLLSHES